MNDYVLGNFYYIGTQKVRFHGEVGAQLMFTPVDATTGRSTGAAMPLLASVAATTVANSLGGTPGSKLLLEVVI